MQSSVAAPIAARLLAMTPQAVLYADDSVIVVDKPAGLLAVPGRGEAGRDCLAARVQARFPDALVVHRLDMATSGLMLFARSLLAQRRLNAEFAARRVHKRYVAVVEGLLQQDSGVIELPLAADWPRRPRQLVDLQRGKPALTRWRVLGRADDSTRVELEPASGRSHQLRVHMQSIGHPILGDQLYSAQPQRSERLLLHACRLEFTHPGRGEGCVFESPPPY